MTLFKALYGYDPKIRIDITSTEDVATKGRVLAA